MKKLFFITFLILSFGASSSFAFKLGVVDLNRALNESEAGMRSKSVLESRGRQKQQEFKLEEEGLRKLAGELRNNPLLTPQAKRQKEDELRQRQDRLKFNVRQVEQGLKQEERRLTEGIFKELKNIIRKVAKRNKYDMILEKNAAQVILYMGQEQSDITDKVIDLYDSFKSSKK